MSRLYWSNLPDAKRPRGGTSTLWSSLTTEDLPMPEYPETSTSSGVPLATTRSKEASKVSISDSIVSLESAVGLACRVRQARIRRCGAEFPIQQGSAEDRSQRQPLFGNVPQQFL